MNKLMLILAVLFSFVLNTYAEESCITGYACSLEDMKKQEQQSVEQNNQDNKQPKEKPKKEKRKSIFVDGGKYNKPEYTEMFMFNNWLP